MDTDLVDFCRMACLTASAKGYVGSFDMDTSGKIRWVLRSLDGHTVVGDFRDTRQEAIEDTCKIFMTDTNDTASGKSS